MCYTFAVATPYKTECANTFLKSSCVGALLGLVGGRVSAAAAHPEEPGKPTGGLVSLTNFSEFANTEGGI